MLDIPSLDLAGNNSGVSSPVLQSPISAEQPPPSPPVSPRRTSFSSGTNGLSSSGRRSGSSSRSTSFSLPNEAKGEISSQERRIGPDDEEVEEDEEMDEEGKLRLRIYLLVDVD
jgi:protein phosphatase inhibitor 2